VWQLLVWLVLGASRFTTVEGLCTWDDVEFCMAFDVSWARDTHWILTLESGTEDRSTSCMALYMRLQALQCLNGTVLVRYVSCMGRLAFQGISIAVALVISLFGPILMPCICLV